MSLRCVGINKLAKSFKRNNQSSCTLNQQELLEARLEEIKILITAFSRTVERFNDLLDEIDGALPNNPSSNRCLYKHNGKCLCAYNLNVQSQDQQDCCDGDDDLQQQNVKFSDSVAGQSVGMPMSTSYGNMDKSANTSLRDYLSRPVEVSTITWTEGTNLNTDLQIWHLYFSKAAIKRKLDNYSLLRCKLHVKVVINASPFYYGLGLVSYRPLTSFNPAPVASGTGLENIEFMGKSQRPHIWIRAENNEGGEMVLPFLYHKQYLDATSASDFQDMGTLSFDSLSLLNNANSVAGSGCTIQVYAWAEDIELGGPTLDLAVQSKDEYEDDGPISAPASAVAKVANGVVKVIDSTGLGLFVKPFAVATEMAASTVGSIARLFGFTNVPVIDDIHAMKSSAFPMLSSAAIGTPVEKLTLDPKNELTIDSKVMGIDVEDELLVSSIVQRPSHLDQFSWAASDSPDTLLFSIDVTPFYTGTATVSNQTYVQGTPGWLVAKAFEYWRGDMIFTFKVIASQYHRGRLRITWDPHSNIGVTSDNTAEIYQIIVDISKDKDIRVRVPWAQPTPYNETPHVSTATHWGVAARSNSLTQFNGTLTVRVLTEQTSPVASADVKVDVLAECADNMVFMGPRDLDADEILTPYAVQSKDMDATVAEYTFGGKNTVTDDCLELIYGGEKIFSLRTLMRRASFHRMMFHSTGTSEVFFEYSYMNRKPLLPGYDADGIVTVDETIGASTAPFNYVHWSYLTWFTQPFVGTRGSIIWHINAESHEVSGSVGVQRTTKVLTAADYDLTVGTTLSNDDGYQATYFLNVSNAGCSGLSLTNQHTQAGLSILAPMYSKFKMQSNNPETRTLGTAIDDSDTDTLQTVVRRYEKADNHAVQSFYCAAGTDYNPVFFLNVPTYYVLAAWPTVPP